MFNKSQRRCLSKEWGRHSEVTVPVGGIRLFLELGDPGGSVDEYEVIILLDDILNVVVDVNEVSTRSTDLKEGVILGQESLSSKADRGFGQELAHLALGSGDGHDKAVILEGEHNSLQWGGSHVDRGGVKSGMNVGGSRS
jgi:hypothetical protein